MKKYNLTLSILFTLGLFSCTSNPPVAVVQGEQNADYVANKVIHISESQTELRSPTSELIAQKPKGVIAQCFDGSYALDTQTYPCAQSGGIKHRFTHYSSD
ncbi:hypothetical protein PTQ27_03685 [Mannheimia sp. AT1]|uniref:Lipoprotein n=1 Tax=Mannheimia cairinae TaxID=3025936 RepID=A0ABT5MN13_9PAST|nr:hypothetical protein [Mannheimia cairinae]MDD0823575.1 hypothetical protein [Mannheimia cairinae]MDD0826788.1 hypothetical protein [Mannheimia cairinae]